MAGIEVVAGEAISKMMETQVIDNKIIVVEEAEEVTLIGTTTTTTEVNQEPSPEEDIEVVAEQIITKPQMTPKHLATREKNKWAGKETTIAITTTHQMEEVVKTTVVEVEIIVTTTIEVVETETIVITTTRVVKIDIKNIQINCKIPMT